MNSCNLLEMRGSTRTGTRTQDQLIKSQLLYQLSYPRLHFPHAGAGQLGASQGLGKLIIAKTLNNLKFGRSGRRNYVFCCWDSALFAHGKMPLRGWILFKLLFQLRRIGSHRFKHVGTDDDELEHQRTKKHEDQSDETF